MLRVLFEAALGIDVDIWLHTQADYNKQVAKSDHKFLEKLAAVRKIAAVL